VRRDRAVREGHRRLLDAWVPPANAGEPIGCLTTSFTFDPAFFEEDCLARFLALERDPKEDGPLYLIERDERLASVLCAAAVVDAHHCRGARSLRWDLLPARPMAGIAHAKITVLCWQRHLRLLVASANCTSDGYRRNREGIAVLDYGPDEAGSRSVGEDLIVFLRDLLTACAGNGPSTVRCVRLLDYVASSSSSPLVAWGSDNEATGFRIHPVLIAPGRGEDLVRQVEARWPDSAPPRRAEVISPFYALDGVNRPAAALWSVLAKRGEATVTYIATGHHDQTTDRDVLYAPRSLITTRPDRDGCSVEVRRADESAADPGEDNSGFRPLHLKSLQLISERWTAWMVGSSNWTSRGTGCGGRPNWEANLLYLVSDRHPDLRQRISHCQIPSVDCDPDSVEWQPLVDGDDVAATDAPTLPSGFQQAVLTGVMGAWSIHFTIRSDDLPAGWIVRDPASAQVILTAAMLPHALATLPVTIPWTPQTPPSGFVVEWSAATGSAWWPVDVDSAATLPPPDELRNLPLEVLLRVLTSARPPHQVLADWIRRSSRQADVSHRELPYDPHAAVDTSGFLLQRLRVVSQALTALRQRLEKPMPTREALAWRLHGPFGPMALAKALAEHARSPAETAFLSTELALELARVRPVADDHAIPADEVRSAIAALVDRIHAGIDPGYLAALPGLADYARTSLSEMRA